MSYIQSNNINVFPSAYRTDTLQGKWTNENNFVNILNSLIDVDSYVLSYVDNILKVVIHGYYFEIDVNLNSYSDLWLVIRLEKGAEGSDALVRFDNGSPNGLDENNQFYGISLEETDPSDKYETDYRYHYLKVQNAAAPGTVINKVRLSADSIGYDTYNTVKDELDSKQDTLTPGNGLTLTSDSQISIKDSDFAKLEGLNNKGANDTFVYFNSSWFWLRKMLFTLVIYIIINIIKIIIFWNVII